MTTINYRREDHHYCVSCKSKGKNTLTRLYYTQDDETIPICADCYSTNQKAVSDFKLIMKEVKDAQQRTEAIS